MFPFAQLFLEGQLAMCIKRLKNIPTLWRGFPGGSVVKNRPAVQEPQKIQFRSLGWEDPLRREWLPTLVFLPGEFHGQNSWWTTVHKVAKSRTRLKQLSMHSPCDPIIPLLRNWLHTRWGFRSENIHHRVIYNSDKWRCSNCLAMGEWVSSLWQSYHIVGRTLVTTATWVWIWVVAGTALLISTSLSGLPWWLSGKKRTLLPMQETQFRSLGQEDPMKKEMETHSSILAWKSPLDRGAWWDIVHGVHKKSHTWFSD